MDVNPKTDVKTHDNSEDIKINHNQNTDNQNKPSDMDINNNKTEITQSGVNRSQNKSQKLTKEERIDNVRKQFEEYGFRLYKSTDGYYRSCQIMEQKDNKYIIHIIDDDYKELTASKDELRIV